MQKQATAVTPSPKSEFRRKVEEWSGQDVSRCYQCGKCTAGCPTSYAMDLGPRRIIRAVQLGLQEEAMSSSSIWLCVSCQTCSARCPRDIDIARVMESVALLSLLEGRKPAVEDVERLHSLFLAIIGRFGRIYDLGLAGGYALLSGRPFDDLSLALRMLSKGKFPLLPSTPRGAPRVSEIQARVKILEAKTGSTGQGENKK